VVEEREQQDGELVEVSRNYFAQAKDGSVCYFGEDVDIYERGKVVSHESAWLAGVGKNRPGIVMPATPEAHDFYAQEEAEGVAQDRAEITLVGKKVSVPAGTFSDTLETKECSPLEPGVFETKYYARGVGQITDGPIELVSPR
jgi:hypothetical protein